MQKSNNIKVLGVSGYARCGKNTFVEIAKNILAKNNYRVMELAFANKLKDEVQEMLHKNRFALDVLNLSADEKEKVRPLFVFWGCQRRAESDGGLYWVNEVDRQVEDLVADCYAEGESTDRRIVLVSDVRFPNEAGWIHEKWGGDVIHLKKFHYKVVSDVMIKSYDLAPNVEEATHDPKVIAVADVMTEWEDKRKSTILDASSDLSLQAVVLDALNQTKAFKFTGKLIL